MAIPTAQYNQLYKDYFCSKYGLDSYEFDPYGGKTTSSNSRSIGWFDSTDLEKIHISGVLHFVKDGKKYSYIPIVRLTRKQWDSFLGTEIWHDEDLEQMEKDFALVLQDIAVYQMKG